VHQLVAELERLVAAGLNRPGIAAPLAAGLDGNTAYLVQEFFAADSLDVLIRDYGAAPPADAIQIAVQIAGALDFAAVADITHGALHPRDLLLSTDEARMTGLGIARALERAGASAPIRRPYTAPERVAGSAWDRRADIFSLAAIIHEMLWARRVSATGEQAANALTDIAGGNLPALRSVFGRALAESPADRFATALEFAAALKAALPGVTSRSTAARDAVAAAATEDATIVQRRPVDTPVAAEPSRPIVAQTLPLEPPAPVAPAPVPDIALRTAEDARYADVESGPAIIAPGVVPHAVRPSTGPLDLQSPSVAERALDRSAMWPLALALIVGLALGFASGYGVGIRDRTATATGGPAPSTPAPAAATATAATTPGREFTDAPVGEPPRAGSPAKDGATAAAPPVKPVAPPPAEPPAPRPNATVGVETGHILVRSTPSGARVFVDGRERGRTPATIRDLARGSHRVRVVQDGFTMEERRVVVSGSRPSQALTFTLARARTARAAGEGERAPSARPRSEGFSGALSVDSLPPGAKVYVDGKLIGTTPMVVSEVGAGEHVVRLEHDGYRRWSSSVRVVAGERNRVTASLEK